MNLYFFELTHYEFYAFLTLGILLLIQLYYYLFVYGRVSFCKSSLATKNSSKQYDPVSVVICARNEEENLALYLPSVLEQDYPDYEVVVVNDCSSDDSELLLQRLAAQYKHLRVTTIQPDVKFTHGKKLALTVGIKAASHNQILLTDADCKPESKDWIKCMAENFSHKHSIILGYGGYFHAKGLLNKLVRIDTLYVAMQYLGFSLAKRPYMGVGRNLAYTKELYMNNKGFASHSHILSGDDDLFIQEVATKHNTVIEIRANAHTRSSAAETFSEWVRQKRRHLTTSPLYRKSVKWRLGWEPISRVLFWATGIYLISTGFYPIIVASVLLFRLLVVQLILGLVKRRLNEKKLFFISVAYDLFSPMFYALFMLINRVSLKQKKWK